VNFITAGGVFLQSLVFGYGGVRFHDQGMRLDPLLPPGAENAPFRSHFIQKDQFTKTCSGQSIGVKLRGKGVLFSAGVTAMKLRGLNFADAEFDILVDGPGSAQFLRRESSSSSSHSVRLHQEASDEGAYWLTQQQRGASKAVAKTDDSAAQHSMPVEVQLQ
jgi:hypothetical protein